METLTDLTPENKNRKSADENTHAAILHLSSFSSYLIPLGSILCPLVFWSIWKSDSEFVDKNGKEAMNFNISFMIYKFAAVLIGGLMFLSPLLNIVHNSPEQLENNPIGLLLSIPGIVVFAGGLGIISILWLILIIVAAVKAGNGEVFHYPLTIKFIK